MARILFVEDETEVLGTLTKYFERQGHTAHGARTGEDALAIVERFQPDVAVLDVMLQEGPAGPDGMNGFEICSEDSCSVTTCEKPASSEARELV